MQGQRTLVLAVVTSMVAMVGLAAWGWSLQPDQPGRWLVNPLVLAGFWAIVELMTSLSPRRADRDARGVLAWHRAVFATVGMFAVGHIGLRVAIQLGVLGVDWASPVQRGSGVVFGVMLMLWGNFLPKVLSPWSAKEEPFDWLHVHRFVGWVATLGGAAMALAWLLLPLGTARLAAGWILLAAGVLAAGRKWYSVATHPGRRDRIAPQPDQPVVRD